MPGTNEGPRPVLLEAERRSLTPKLRQHPEAGRPAYHDMLARVAVLSRAAVLFALPEGTLRALARRLRRIAVPSGEMIVCQGEPGDTIFFIEQGRCRVVVERPPSVVTVALLTDGDFFGEGACLLNRPQQASVFAQTDCTILAVDRQSLRALLRRDRTTFDTFVQVAEHRFKVYADTTVQASWGTMFKEATVVGVYSPKGGSGGTCLSLNVVGSLSRRHPGEVLLLDLDFPYTHAALLAGLVPTTCLARLAAVPPDSFEEAVLSGVMYHSGGPMILAGSLRPEEADEVTPELVTRAIGVLRKTFRYIVVDLGVTISDSTLALLDLTQHVVLVVAPELSAVKSAADAVDILLQLGTPHDRLTVVMNSRSIKPAVTRPAIERMLKRQVNIEVGFDYSRPDQAAVSGEILSLTNPRSEIAKGAEALAELLDLQHGRDPSKQKVATTKGPANGNRGLGV
ncbi:MAG TPA: cyclic nucleotide-binding domain-containing protein [Candidatus Nitrosopolaris sp.]|nr:cyclic nucleotide-binding domain-containing protein [Candidatus Nitrosopolaris sp.]